MSHLPLAGFYYLADLEVEGYQSTRDTRPQAIDRYVSNSYHETMSVPLRQGRYFNALERPGGPLAVIVNEQFARRYFPNASPIGRRLRYAGGTAPWYTIVGVSAGEPAGGMEEEPKPMVYFSMDQSAWPLFHLIVKSRTDLDSTVNAVKQSLRKISPAISPYEIRSLDLMVLDSTWRVRYSMMLLTALATVALVLAALGVYGVLRYAVGRTDPRDRDPHGLGCGVRFDRPHGARRRPEGRGGGGAGRDRRHLSSDTFPLDLAVRGSNDRATDIRVRMRRAASGSDLRLRCSRAATLPPVDALRQE